MIISGYLLLKKGKEIYKGVDRERFEPVVIESLVNKSSINFHHIWELYPKGWLQIAFRKFEENAINIDELSLIKNQNVAFSILDTIPTAKNDYEVIKADVYLIEDQINREEEISFLGFDLAYLGGDFYSAIKNGLLINPSESLKRKYFSLLNKHNLFENNGILSNYITDFREVVRSEQNSKFYIYSLSKISI